MRGCMGVAAQQLPPPHALPLPNSRQWVAQHHSYLRRAAEVAVVLHRLPPTRTGAGEGVASGVATAKLFLSINVSQSAAWYDLRP